MAALVTWPHLWMWGCVTVVMLVMCPSSVEAQPTIQANGLFVVGKEKTLGCYITSAETVSGFPLYWSKDGVVVTGINQEIVPVTANVKSYNIFYRFNVTASDNLAVFTCTANFPSGSTSATWTVYAYKGPDTPVITGPSSVVSGVGSTWRCGVDGASNTAPSVFWQFGNNSRLASDTFTTTSQIYTDSNQLEIHRETSILTLTVTPGAPSFTLSCRAVHFDTSIETSADFPVTVLYPPQISGGNINYTATEGSTATLFCQINAYPIVTSVTWYKNGYRLDMTSGRISGGTALSPSLAFNNVVRADAGWYMCGAANSQGSTNGTNNYLTIRYIPIITYSQNPVSGLSGSDLTLSCNINSIPRYTTVFWHRVNTVTGAKTLINAANNPAKYANGTASTTPALTIRSLAAAGDAGLYRCSADNNVGRGEGTNLQVQVNYPPHVRVNATHYDVSKGENVTLWCDYDANPEAVSVSWVKDSALLSVPSADGRLSGGDLTLPSLTVHSLRLSDSGHYQCRVTSPLAAVSSSVITVDVVYEPIVETPNTRYTVREGDDITLGCCAKGYPPISGIIWYKSRHPVNMEDHPGKYSGASTTNASLQIHDVSRSDAANYTCQAHNAAGVTQSHIISLDVTYAPEVNVGMTHYDVSKGENVTLWCDYDANPEAVSVSWVKDSALLSVPSADGRLSGGDLTLPSLTVHSLRLSDSGHYQCRVTSPVAAVSSSAVTVDVRYEPVIVTPLLTYTLEKGHDVTLACSANGYPAVSGIIWYKAGIPVNFETTLGKYSGATIASPSLVIRNVTKEDSGAYTCQATNAVGAGQSDVITVNVTYAPILTLTATSYTRDVTDSLTLQCTYDANPSPFSVTWTKDSQVVDVTGSGGRYSGSNLAFPSLTINQVTSADAGLYVCSAVNSVGQGSSGIISVVVNYPAEFTNTVSQLTEEEGTFLTLPCSFSAYPSPTTLLWFRNGAQLVVTGRYSGGTLVTPGLTISSVTASDTGTYFCRVINAKGISDSPPINLAVLYPPVIISNNSRLEGRELNSLTIPCLYNAYPSASQIHWTKDGVDIFVTSDSYEGGIVGNPNLTIVSLVPADAGSYECVVVTSLGNASTGNIPVIVDYLPRISMGNTSEELTVTAEQSLTLHCRFDAFPAVTSLQWLHDGRVINMPVSAKYSGGDLEMPDLTIRSLNVSDAGLYQCRVGNDVGISDSDNVTVYVSHKPQITGTQGTLSATEPQAVTLTCQVDALPALTSLRWVKDGQDVVTGDTARYSGGTVGTPSLTIFNVGARDGGQYYCVAANSMGTTSGAVTTLSVDYFPVITAPNIVVTGLSGGSATLTVAIAANPALTSVEWRKRDTVSSTSYTVVQVTSASQKYQGGTVGNPSLQIGSLSSNDEGYYRLVATNAVGTRQSSEFALTVTSIPTTPSVSNLANTYLEGSLISLTCSSPSITPSPSYRWLKVGGGGGSIVLQEGAVLTISSARPEDSGEVRCEASNSLGSASVTVNINVLYRPRASSALTNVTSALGETVTMNCATQANPPASSFTWLRNGQVVVSSTSSSLFTVTVTTSSDLGSYSCLATNDVGTSDPISVFVLQDASGGANIGGNNVGASTEDSGLSTATLVLIIIVVLIVIIVVVLILVYCCSKHQCFRKDNDVGPTHPPPPPPPVIPTKSYGYYNRGAVAQNGHISSIEKTPPADTSNGFGHYNGEPGLTISVPGGTTPRPHHLPPLGQDGVPQEKESARSEDPHREKRKKKRRRRHYDEESGSPSRHQYDPDNDFQTQNKLDDY